MHWFWFALISVVSISASALIPRILMKREDNDPVVFTIIVQSLNGLLCLIVALFVGFHIPPVSLWPLFLVSGALYAFGTLFFFKAAKQIEASEVSILSGAGAIVPIAISFVFLAERLSAIQWLGAFIILVAVVVVQYERKHFRLNQGSWYALAGTSAYGIAVVIDGVILQTFDTFSFLPIIFFMTAIVLLIVYPKKLPSVGKELVKFNSLVMAYGVLYATAAETFYITLKSGAMVSQMTTIMRASIILTVLFAMVFLKERSHPWKKLMGAVLTTIGVLLLR